MQISRYYQLESIARQGKVLIVVGARQVGKTTLLKNYLSAVTAPFRFDTGEDIRIQEVFAEADIRMLKEYAAGNELIVIDEAQKIRNIGQGLKLLVDHMPDLTIIITGSSSFELAGQTGEPLTGRKRTLPLYPVAFLELAAMGNTFDLDRQLEELLVYGCYPEVVTAPDTAEKRQILNELVGSYLLKDIFELDRIRSSKVLLDLLRMLALQVGGEVSLHELGTRLGLDGKTVGRYLDMLEKSFVIFNLRGYSGNLRNEITKKSKYYFLDNGIRNAIISSFNGPELRNDAGQLWENFLVAERLKKQAYHSLYCNNYFWRTWQHHEVDWIEEREGTLFGYEFKWGKKAGKGVKKFLETYPEAECVTVDRNSYRDFIL